MKTNDKTYTMSISKLHPFENQPYNKCRSSYRIRGTSGEPLSQPPYGYIKSPENKKKWIIDEEAACIVRDIFKMALEGKSNETIARILQERKALIPMAYWQAKGYRKGGKVKQPNKYRWCKTTVTKILTQQEYCGDIINFKTYSKSYKNKKRLENPKENWAIFKNVHEPIIDREDFEKVQKIIGKTKRRAPKKENGEKNMFCDFLYCADCGSKLWYHTNTNNKNIHYCSCSNYKTDTRGTCETRHYIRADAIEQVVMLELRKLAHYLENYEEEFSQLLAKKTNADMIAEQKYLEKELDMATVRNDTVSTMFQRLYEDNATGKISDEMFMELSHKYEVERLELKTKIDSLTTVRKLKEVGCEIYFEKEGIFTFDSKGELLITIMSSLAQEESRSISENVTWGQRKRFSDGKVSMPYGQFLGYKKGADGQPEIVPDEAKVVKRIYRMFLDGRTPCAIARMLTSESIPTPGGKTKWQPTVVRSILTNEKYKGAALLQKKFTVDFLTKKQKVNEGEVPQYYVENSHPAIIPPEEWDLVQAEFAKRKEYESYSGTSIFSSKIFCGDCGKVYGPKVWHSADKYRRTIWQCNDKFKGEKCSTPHLTEEQIKEHFMKAYGQLLRELGTVIDDCRMVQAFLCNTTELIDRMRELESEITVVENMVRQLIEDNSLKAQNQNEYYAHYETLSKRLDALHTEYEKHKKERIRREHKHDLIERFICILKSEDDLPMEFDDNTFLAVTDRITVFSDEHLEFTFLNGVTFTTQL